MPREKTTKKPEASTNGKVEETPSVDALGERSRVQIIAQQIAQLQSQRFELEAIQVGNDRSDGDPMDGAQPGPDGKVVTYGERKAMLSAAETRLCTKYEDLMPQVQAFIDGVRASETA